MDIWSQYDEKRRNKKWLEKSLNELQSKNIIMYYDFEEIRGTRNSLKDLKYKIVPHLDFIAEIKRANKRLALATTDKKR